MAQPSETERSSVTWKVSHANRRPASETRLLPPRPDLDIESQRELQRSIAIEARQTFVNQQAQLTQVAREAKKAMLCQQVVEAARYQRSFFDRGTEPRPELLIAKRQAVSLVKVTPQTKRGSGRARRASPPTTVAEAVSQQEAMQNASAVSSFMLLDLKKVRILLNDIHIILAPTQPADYSDDVTRQLGGLYLFQPTGFAVGSPSTAESS